MKVKYISKVLLVIGLILSGCFVISAGYDCYMYFKPIGGWQYYSSPLYLYIVIRALEFLLPAIISISVGYIIARPSIARRQKSGVRRQKKTRNTNDANGFGEKN